MITVIRHPDNVRHQSQADDSPRRNSCCLSSYSQARQQHLLMLRLLDEGEQNWRTFVRNNSRQLCRVQSSPQSMKHYVQSPNHSSRHESSLARLSCCLVCCAPHPPSE